MRLWHEELISKLPRQQLLGQHRECCALRGGGWGKKHETVDYVFKYSPIRLYYYHLLIMEEMKKRGYLPSEEWFDKLYRGKKEKAYDLLKEEKKLKPIYPEHNEKYYVECIENLKNKGIEINF
ncbi:TIGR02328 family protein [Streptobacillus canis]|uniref:TIGR02328 family protein n=1 Tax=Streptobacillus canis TaxID=2678686 RepID=UPI0012E22DFB|nr:TIGR02328 family protein [Streptobacillus canis]